MQYCFQVLETAYVSSLQTELTYEMLRIQISRMLSIILSFFALCIVIQLYNTKQIYKITHFVGLCYIGNLSYFAWL